MEYMVINKNSKAISGVSRSGTTWTFTRADGSTFTVTQQDNNTTYANATTAAAGLMSASDKTALDKITYSTSTTITVASGVSKRGFTMFKFGRVIVYMMFFDITSSKSNGATIFSGIPEAFRSVGEFHGLVQNGDGVPRTVVINANGTITAGGSSLPTNTWYTGHVVAMSKS